MTARPMDLGRDDGVIRRGPRRGHDRVCTLQRRVVYERMQMRNDQGGGSERSTGTSREHECGWCNAMIVWEDSGSEQR
jgi:hypothetical protein